jgi:hypothetical protein
MPGVSDAERIARLEEEIEMVEKALGRVAEKVSAELEESK